MYNFFIENFNINAKECLITGADFNHVKNVLRMKVGEELLVSDGKNSHLCRIESYSPSAVVLSVIEKNYADTSLPIEIHLFQGLPKSDKMELIIQKAVELGVTEITPVEMARSIVKVEEKKKGQKTSRWQAIAESAAKQSKRTVIPKVNDIVNFRAALDIAKNLDILLIPYESKNGMEDTKLALNAIKGGYKVGVMIGPEGGFDQKEIDLGVNNGGKIISLGKRILRTETAAITSVAMIMLHAEMNI